MKKYRKITALTIVLAITMSMFANAITFQSALPIDTNIQYISQKAMELISMSIPNYESIKNWQIGSKINIYSYTEDGISEVEYSSYPIIGDGNIMAIANIAINSNNQPILSIGTRFSEELNLHFKSLNNEPFALVYDAEGIKLVDSNYNLSNFRNLYNSNRSEILSQNAIVSNSNKISISNIKIMSDIIGAQISRSDDRNLLFVPFVSQGSYDICWAACIASMLNYYRNTNYTALQIANAAGFGLIPLFPNQIKQVLDSYWLDSSSEIMGKINFTNFMTNINNDKLTLLRLVKYDNSGGHMVLAYGYANNASPVISYMEPNYGFSAVQVPQSGDLVINVDDTVYYQYSSIVVEDGLS